MNNLTIINEQEVLGKHFVVYGDFDNPLFLAKDVAEWIEYSKTSEGYYNVSRMVNTVDESEKITITNNNSGGKVTFLTEDGLYEVLMQSRKPIAKEFKKKVKEILKSIRKTGVFQSQNAHTVSFKEQVECVEVISRMLRVNDAGKLNMLNTLYGDYNLPVNFLPKYEFNGSREIKSATELLKRFGLNINTKAFNILMLENGFLEERVRRSTKEPNKERKYKALTEKGLAYGENAISPQNQREVQPLYYADRFVELYEIITGIKVSA